MTSRLAALVRALDAGAGRFFDPSAIEARKVLERAGTRLELSMEHTVVALAGSTGGGKSSLFNLICGLDIARVGVRRPTTSQPLACVWGNEGAQPLLDWLEIPEPNRVSRESVLEPGSKDPLNGLILLDLPDHDSTEAQHRLTVDRMVETVDLLVWVMDPQKYADAEVHEHYLRPLSAHSEVTVVVLNQIDRLPAADIEGCVADLRRLLDDDGLSATPILPLSAATGEGTDALLELLRETGAKRQASRERIDADARRVARRMTKVLGSAQAGEIDEAARERLAGDVAAAADVDTAAQTAGEAYLRRGRRALVPGVDVQVDHDAVQQSIRDLGDQAVGALSGGWGGSVRSVADEAANTAPQVLDETLRAVEPGPTGGGVWWRLTGVVEWLALLTGLVGGAWMLVLEARTRFEVDWLDQLAVPEPEVSAVPLPMLLLVAGGASGLAIAAARTLIARRIRRRRAEEIRQRLHDVVAEVVDEQVILPLRAELDQFHAFRHGLDEAGRE